MKRLILLCLEEVNSFYDGQRREERYQPCTTKSDCSGGTAIQALLQLLVLLHTILNQDPNKPLKRRRRGLRTGVGDVTDAGVGALEVGINSVNPTYTVDGSESRDAVKGDDFSRYKDWTFRTLHGFIYKSLVRWYSFDLVAVDAEMSCTTPLLQRALLEGVECYSDIPLSQRQRKGLFAFLSAGKTEGGGQENEEKFESNQCDESRVCNTANAVGPVSTVAPNSGILAFSTSLKVLNINRVQDLVAASRASERVLSSCSSQIVTDRKALTSKPGDADAKKDPKVTRAKAIHKFASKSPRVEAGDGLPPVILSEMVGMDKSAKETVHFLDNNHPASMKNLPSHLVQVTNTTAKSNTNMRTLISSCRNEYASSDAGSTHIGRVAEGRLTLPHQSGSGVMMNSVHDGGKNGSLRKDTPGVNTIGKGDRDVAPRDTAPVISSGRSESIGDNAGKKRKRSVSNRTSQKRIDIENVPLLPACSYLGAGGEVPSGSAGENLSNGSKVAPIWTETKAGTKMNSIHAIRRLSLWLHSSSQAGPKN